MAHPNGAWPASALAPVPGQSGLFLEPRAAKAWGAIVAEVQRRYGWSPWLTDAYRSLYGYYGQIETFLRRYDAILGPYSGPFGDVRYWQGVRYVRVTGAAAAVPGTSNHGRALAVDCSGLGPFDSLRYRQFADVATEFGMSNAEGRSVNEPWHWVFSEAWLISNVTVTPGVDITVPDVTLPDPLNPEDPMAGFSAQDIQDLAERGAAQALANNLEALLEKSNELDRKSRQTLTRAASSYDSPEFRMLDEVFATLLAKNLGALAPDNHPTRATRRADMHMVLAESGLKGIVEANVHNASPADLAAIAKAVADEEDRRERERLSQGV